MVEVATRLGAEMPFGLTQLKAVLEFEVALAKVSYLCNSYGKDYKNYL